MGIIRKKKPVVQESTNEPEKRGLSFYTAGEHEKILSASRAADKKILDEANACLKEQQNILDDLAREKRELLQRNQDLQTRLQEYLDREKTANETSTELISIEELDTLRTHRDFEEMQSLLSDMSEQMANRQNELLIASGAIHGLENDNQQLLLQIATLKAEKEALARDYAAKLKVLSDRYQSSMTGHAKNLEQVTETFLDYAKSMRVLSRAYESDAESDVRNLRDASEHF